MREGGGKRTLEYVKGILTTPVPAGDFFALPSMRS
jgi:hypothetical protein